MASDVLSSLDPAIDGIAAALGKDAVAVVLGVPDGTEGELVAVRGLPDDVSSALTRTATRTVLDTVRRWGEPVCLPVGSLRGDAGDLQSVLHRHEIETLAVFPLVGERALVGYVAVPFARGEKQPRGDGEGWRLLCRAPEGVQLFAAVTALRTALVADRRHPAQLFDGVLVVDRRLRVAMADGLFESMPGWCGEVSFGRQLTELAGGRALGSVSPSRIPRLDWSEHTISADANTGVPLAVCAVRLRGQDSLLDGGLVYFARDVRVDSTSPPDGTARMLALAMRVGHVADDLLHAVRLGDPSTRRSPERGWMGEALAREIEEAGRLVETTLERCLPRDAEATVEVNELLEEVLRHYDDFEERGIRLLTHLGKELPAVPGDRLELLRAFRILVQDARDAVGAEGGILTARTWGDDTWVYGAVSDDRSGSSTSPHGIVEPIFQSADRGDRGLEAVREILQRCAGRLVVERRPKVWNRITVMLRQERRETPRAEKSPTKASRSNGRGTDVANGLRVLVVDDNAALRSVLRRYLERRGHAVEEAGDGDEGLRAVSGEAFDRIIVDMHMPVRDGPAFYEALDGIDPTLQARTIFVTGGFVTEEVERFILASGRPSVKKPFDLAEMARTVEG